MRPIPNPERLSHAVFEKTTTKIVPGPGNYEFNDGMHATGKYFPTKFKSSGSKVWNPPSSQRFKKSSKFHPTQPPKSQAPATTTPSTRSTTPGSTCFRPTREPVDADSTRRTGAALSMFLPKSQKVLHRLALAPGPGSYRQPSEFGQYDQAKLSQSQLD